MGTGFGPLPILLMLLMLSIGNFHAFLPMSPSSSAIEPILPANPEKKEAGLAPLVLTLTELIRQLMEAQIIRRMEAGLLSEQQLDEAAESLQTLEAQVVKLCEVFEIDPADLNLDLGDLGSLLPKQGGYYPGEKTGQPTILELLDRLLNVGIVLEGDVDLGLANIDLVYLKLRLMLSSRPDP
jgi:hypothetical protein